MSLSQRLQTFPAVACGIGLLLVLAFFLQSDETSVSDVHPLDMMVIAFEGNYPKSEIKARLDMAMKLYQTPITEENYSRAGSVLVALRKEYGFHEMEILSHMIRSHVPGVYDGQKVDFPSAASLSVAFLSGGDR